MLKPIIIERTLSGLKRPPMSLYRIEENCAIAGILAHGEIPELLTAIFAMDDEEITLIGANWDMNLKPATTISGCSTDTKQIAALNSSAPHVNPAVNGMVHPKGKAALKEVVTGSRHLIEQDSGVDSNTLVQISSLAQDSSHWAVPSNKIRTHMCSHRVRRWGTHSRVSHFDSRLRRCDKHDALLAKTHPHPDYKDSVTLRPFFRTEQLQKYCYRDNASRRRRYQAKPMIPILSDHRLPM
ncbi:hypothetical protein [Cupriavidus taiwanensis]|uniref:Uncharacterized protein n=1 Tax=Cupriavidus taiwanensis TaxID=164546 RepID=A0A375JDF1_9BURK|nr:hypothetical protein [Cupriavidus taiwanensis]SPS02120.1 hypothetical protein CBM2634_P100016 [Cupriavidus taiwanensis]